MDQFNQEELLAKAQELYQSLPWWAWAAIGGVLLLLIIIVRVRKASRKKRLKEIAPSLSLHAFQIAPLARDAFFKVRNTGEIATLTALNIKGRKDILIKNAVAGHQIEKDKVYSILLEAGATEKIRKNFQIELVYIDSGGNAYKQLFQLDQSLAKTPKLVKRV